jgi:hypothetical protein
MTNQDGTRSAVATFTERKREEARIIDGYPRFLGIYARVIKGQAMEGPREEEATHLLLHRFGQDTMKKAVTELMEGLKPYPLRCQVLVDRFGFRRRLEAVGSSLSPAITKERVRVIEAGAIRFLRRQSAVNASILQPFESYLVSLGECVGNEHFCKTVGTWVCRKHHVYIHRTEAWKLKGKEGRRPRRLSRGLLLVDQGLLLCLGDRAGSRFVREAQIEALAHLKKLHWPTRQLGLM